MSLTEDQKRRCLIAAQYLEDVVSLLPEEQFDMDIWRDEDTPCGTVACAAGHLSDCHALRSEGYYVHCNTGYYCGPSFYGTISLEALDLFFGTYDPFQAEHYFHRNLRDPERGITPMDVADELRRIAGES